MEDYVQLLSDKRENAEWAALRAHTIEEEEEEEGSDRVNSNRNIMSAPFRNLIFPWFVCFYITYP